MFKNSQRTVTGLAIAGSLGLAFPAFAEMIDYKAELKVRVKCLPQPARGLAHSRRPMTLRAKS